MTEKSYYENQLEILNSINNLEGKKKFLENIDFNHKIENKKDAELIKSFRIFLDGLNEGILKEKIPEKIKPVFENPLDEMDSEKLKDLIILRQEDEATELIAQKIKEEFYIYSTKDDLKSEMWIYENGIYQPNGESCIKEICRRLLGKSYTPQRANKVIEKVRTDSFIDADDFFKKEQENLFEQPFLNGILNLKTKEIKPFNPKKIFFNKIPINFISGKDCPKIKKFFKEILKNEEDSVVMFEIFGFLLSKKYFPQIAVMLLGDGENGKGVLGSLIRRFIGILNCCSVPLNQLKADSFSCSKLFGKLVNHAGDISNTDLKDTGRFKELTSGTDLINAKRKFQTDLSFMNYAKLLFSCNQLPRVYDFSYGFWRRWMIIEFPFIFLKDSEYELRKNESNIKKANSEIFKEISSDEELSGLLNEALKGLDRLNKNKQFSYSKSTAEVKELWIRKSDSFTAFCLDCLEEDYSGEISKKFLRKKFNDYCRKHKIKGASDISIKITLQNMFGALDSKKQDGFNRENIWEGIKFKENYNNVKGVNGFSKSIGNGDLYKGAKSMDTLDTNDIPIVKIDSVRGDSDESLFSTDKNENRQGGNFDN